MKRCFVIFVLFSTFLFASCSGKKSPITMGELDGICYPNGTCNEGLICDEESNLCVKIEFSDDSENNDTDTENDDFQNDISADTSSDDIDSSDSVADNTDTIQDSDSDTNSGKNQGEIDGECYPNNTCNEGLICDVENNICIKDPGNSEEPEDDSDNIENTDNDTDTDSGDQVSDNDTDTTDSGNDSGDSTTDNDADSIIFDPCESDPCSEITYSTGLCTMTDEGYTCGCLEHYLWNGSVCKAVSIEDVDCIGKPENAVWNTVDKIRQTWDGEEWYPSNEAVYNTNPSDKECRFICDTDFTWNGSECESTVSNHLSLGRICTGQNQCYGGGGEMTCPTSSNENYFGQDAQYAALGYCAPQNFTIQIVADQKIVVDNNTGLEWQRKIKDTTYETWTKAQTYCQDLTYAGYSDWRLPTPHELMTIVDIGLWDPAVNRNYFNNTPSDYFWAQGDYKVHFKSGDVGKTNNLSNNPCYVRCVRGENLPASNFIMSTVDDDVIVTDATTGLIWQKNCSDYIKSVVPALAYCENLTYAGKDDWRLPNKNELASLINYELSKPACDFFDTISPSGRTVNRFYSSSTSNTAYFHVAFDSRENNFGYITGASDSSNLYYVRCVRNAD